MKTFKIFGLFAALVLTFASCETEVEDPAGQRGLGVVPSVTDVNPAVFDSNDLQNTYVQFNIDLSSPATEAIVYVSFNGDKSRVEMGRYSTFPATVQVLLTDAAAGLGMTVDQVELGDVFTFEIAAVVDGKIYFSNAAFNAPLVCAYNPDLVTGSYHAVSDDWGLDGDVTITVDPEDDFKLYVTGLAAIEGLNEDQGPLVMEVNPLNFEVTALKSVLASDVAPWGLPYTGYFYEGFGVLNTCDGTYTMTFTIGVDQGTWGAFNFTFTKN